jgi:resolvase-like protein/helix-turn-helix resolvase-like protein
MSARWSSAGSGAVAGFELSRRDRPAANPVPGGILIGYARCSTERQDLTAQRRILSELGVADDRVYLDHGLTGRNRSRPGLTQALAALREGDTLVVPKLGPPRTVGPGRESDRRLARRSRRAPVPRRGGLRPQRPDGQVFLQHPGDIRRVSRSTCCGCAPARGWRSPARKASSKASRHSPTRRALLLKLHKAGEHTIAELAELFSVSRATVYRELARRHPTARAPSHQG